MGEEDLGDDDGMQGAGSSRGMAAGAAAAKLDQREDNGDDVDGDDNGGGRAATKRKARDAYMHTDHPKPRQKHARKHDMAEDEGMSNAARGGATAAAYATAVLQEKEKEEEQEKESCVICGQVFKGAQGVASHYKSHMKKGTAEEKL